MEDVAVDKKLFFFTVCFLVLATIIKSQELPEDEIQYNLNTYFDNFGLLVVYPTVSITKQISTKTSINGRYLVDAISSASMRSRIRVDGITSATNSDNGGGDDTPDELRHEVTAGVTQKVGEGTVSVNGIYSTEHDYRSNTLALNFNYPFAKKNTTLSIGFVKSWDKVFPQIRTWEKDKDVYSISFGLTQVLSKRFIAQINANYSKMEGFLSDPYQVVTILYDFEAKKYETSHPESRIRKAVGSRFNYYINDKSTIQIGYRYYWDDWEIKSHTFNMNYQRDFWEDVTLGIGIRSYFQNEAYFFKPEYPDIEKYMTVDSKLNSAYSNELQLSVKFDAVYFEDTWFDFLHKENSEFTAKLNFYHRHTDSRDWHSRYKNLYAYFFSLGYRIKLE